MSEVPRGQRQETFADFVVRVVNDALQNTFDASTAKAVQFYIDANVLVRNPDAYEDSVLRMFGKVGGDVVVKSIMKSLLQKSGTPGDPGTFSSLRDCMNAVAKKFR